MKIKYEFKGNFDKALKKCREDLERELKGVIGVHTRNVSLAAKRLAPVDKGLLRNSIHPEIKDLTGEVIANAEYAPYREFGTGNKVNVPPELTDYAMQFKGKGIRQVNTKAQPFLYPAMDAEKNKFFQDCDDKIKKVLNQ